MDKPIELTWLKSFADGWRASEERDRQGHAVLLSGAPGLGKRAAAAWIARRRLGIGQAGQLPEFPAAKPDHPDLHWVRPFDGKHTIHIDQIRALVTDLNMTSYGGGGKVAVIDPANIMTGNAANSLLKTLEEPPGDALLLLIADRNGRLPATIFSRCQRIGFVEPPEDQCLTWLDRLMPGANWPAVLGISGNAPLAAIRASETLDQTDAMAKDFAALSERRASPVEVAARWAKYEPQFVLNWLGRQVQQCIYRRQVTAGRPHEAAIAETVLKRIDRRNLFCYLDIINRLRGQPMDSFDVLLTFESLLIDWTEGLANCRKVFSPGGLLPVPGAR